MHVCPPPINVRGFPSIHRWATFLTWTNLGQPRGLTKQKKNRFSSESLPGWLGSTFWGGLNISESEGQVNSRKSLGHGPGVPGTPGRTNRGLPAGIPGISFLFRENRTQKGIFAGTPAGCLRDTCPSRGFLEILCDLFLMCLFCSLQQATSAGQALIGIFRMWRGVIDFDVSRALANLTWTLMDTIREIDWDLSKTWWTFRIFLNFFLLGGGKGGVRGDREGGRCRHFIENPRRGVGRREGGGGRGRGGVRGGREGVWGEVWQGGGGA